VQDVGLEGAAAVRPAEHAGVTHDGAADFALAVGQVVERQLPGRVTTVMAKAAAPGKIFVDWSQNAHHKTTIAPYSLRARPEPTVSTPVTWDEVEACAAGDDRAALHERRGAGARRGDRGSLRDVLTVEQRLPVPGS
jgi:bifunctional non-homologous end joining protein LigD